MVVGGLEDGHADRVVVERLVDLGDASQPFGDEAAQAGVVAAFGERELLDVIVHVRDGQRRVDDVGALGDFLDVVVFAVVLVFDFADQFFQDVLHRDQAGRPPELVHDDGDVDLAALELAQQLVDRHGLGHEEGRPQQVADDDQVAVLHEREQVLGVNDAQDFVQ